MSARAQIVIRDGADRATARLWIERAKVGSRIDFKGPRRTIEQNDRMWAMLTDVARQKTLSDRKWSTSQWKCIFLHACGRELSYLPPLDGKGGFIPWGQSSSDLSVAEMSELIEFMFAWGAENGVTWSDPAIRELEEQGS